MKHRKVSLEVESLLKHFVCRHRESEKQMVPKFLHLISEIVVTDNQMSNEGFKGQKHLSEPLAKKLPSVMR